MSVMGELTFFLGIQVKQTEQGTFIHKAKYTKDLMKKFNMAEIKPVSTLRSTTVSLGSDEDGEDVDKEST
jgi:isopentenyldiphosphate isomerase